MNLQHIRSSGHRNTDCSNDDLEQHELENVMEENANDEMKHCVGQLILKGPDETMKNDLEQLLKTDQCCLPSNTRCVWVHAGERGNHTED